MPATVDESTPPDIATTTVSVLLDFYLRPIEFSLFAILMVFILISNIRYINDF